MSRAYVVQTTFDIDNPYPDRRSKDWNKLPAIEAGSRFIVSGHSLKSSAHQYAWENDNSALGRLILANSATVEPTTIRELKAVHDCDWSDGEILRILLKLGRITPADFTAVAEAPEDF